LLDTAVSANTGAIPEVEEMLVDSIITEF